MRKYHAGDIVAPLELRTLHGETLSVPDRDHLTHLQFRRFAGCPICNLHLRSVAREIERINSAGVLEIAVFHSTEEAMLPFQGDLPFAVVADPGKQLYAAFGVESSIKAILHPRAWLAGVRGSRAQHPSDRTAGEGGHLGLPADFLIAGDGRVLACKYGTHADDQWTVNELLTLARPPA